MNLNYNKNTPDPKKLPQGFLIVYSGFIMENDLLWTPETEQWEPAELEIGDAVHLYKAVARKIN